MSRLGIGRGCLLEGRGGMIRLSVEGWFGEFYRCIRHVSAVNGARGKEGEETDDVDLTKIER